MKYPLSIITTISIVSFFFGCKKKFDLPVTPAPPVINGYITIDSIQQQYARHYILANPLPTKVFRFSTDINLTCTVTADETSGNIYKSVYVNDATGAIKINLVNSGGLYVGDYIRINLNGIILNDYGKVIQLDSVNIEKSVVKISSGNAVIPVKMTMQEARKLNSYGLVKHQSKLITLDSVQFSDFDKGKVYADAKDKYSIERELYNYTMSNFVIVRTSGYSKFANNVTPCGSGLMTAILGQYNSDVQLTIRDYNDVKISQGGCPLATEDFNFLGDWTSYAVSGNINWKIGNYNGENYAEISNYSSGTNKACESWLISRSFDLATLTDPKLSFSTAYNFSGPALEVYVSTNYISGDPNNALWTRLTPTLSAGSWNWANSGKLSLNDYKSNNTRFGFKYTGTNSNGSTWELDKLVISTQ